MYCEAFQSGDQEPWVFRGGLQAEFQRLALLDCASDLFMLMVPPTPEPFMCPVRPYTPADEGAVFNVCKELYSGFQENCDFCAYHDLVPDLLLGGFTTTSPAHCFILEDEEGICGYVVAAVDAKEYYKKLEIAYLPAMREKYSLVEHQEELSPAKDAIGSFYEFKPVLPECVYTHHPSLVRIGVSPRCKDPSASRRLLAVAFAALKASGSRGVHIPLHISEDTPVGKEFYAKHSFFNIHVADEPTHDTVLLGRVI
jgi:protein O-GlcNAcase/histone acetyltransferase